jgi:hypothetical protein
VTPQLQEAEMLPELAEEFVNVPCDGVLFVRKQLKMSVCQLMPGMDKTDPHEWRNISDFHDIQFRRATASIALHT